MPLFYVKNHISSKIRLYNNYSPPTIALYNLIIALYSLIIVLCTRFFARGARRGGGRAPPLLSVNNRRAIIVILFPDICIYIHMFRAHTFDLTVVTSSRVGCAFLLLRLLCTRCFPRGPRPPTCTKDRFR